MTAIAINSIKDVSYYQFNQCAFLKNQTLFLNQHNFAAVDKCSSKIKCKLIIRYSYIHDNTLQVASELFQP